MELTKKARAYSTPPIRYVFYYSIVCWLIGCAGSCNTPAIAERPKATRPALKVNTIGYEGKKDNPANHYIEELVKRDQEGKITAFAFRHNRLTKRPNKGEMWFGIRTVADHYSVKLILTPYKTNDALAGWMYWKFHIGVIAFDKNGNSVPAVRGQYLLMSNLNNASGGIILSLNATIPLGSLLYYPSGFFSHEAPYTMRIVKPGAHLSAFENRTFAKTPNTTFINPPVAYFKIFIAPNDRSGPAYLMAEITAEELGAGKLLSKETK